MTVMDTITAVLLAAYLVGVVYALMAPARQPDPQRGVAQGCLGMVVLALIAMTGLLAAAVYFDIRWLAKALFFVAVFPAIGLVGGGITHLIQRARGRV